MLTDQGTAAKETAVCAECFAKKISTGKMQFVVLDDILKDGVLTIADCTQNDELKCVFCGKQGDKESLTWCN